MTVKKVLSECLLKMGEKDFVLKENLSERESGLLTDILAALNVAYREIVCEYLPLVQRDRVFFTNGHIDASELSRRILYPIRLTADGQTESFKVYPNRIEADIYGKAEIEYAYVPDTELSIGSNINDMRLTISVLSDATLTQYYFANKVFDLAKSFDTSFRAKIGIQKNKGKSLLLKQRRWWS